MWKESLRLIKGRLKGRAGTSGGGSPAVVLLLACLVCIPSTGYGSETGISTRSRILVIDSYHEGYSWSRDANRGFCAAMTKLGYFNNEQQVSEYNRDGQVTTSKAVIRKLWMDSKRRHTEKEITDRSVAIYLEAKEFRPDLIFLSDDNAIRFIGRQFLDSRVPIVFWGLNNTPVKYGLVDRPDRPGHNVTGVYQSGYYVESLQLLKALVPKARTFAVLSTENPTGRSHYKALERLAQEKDLPLKLVDQFMTNDYDLFKDKVLQLQGKVDSIFLAHFSGLHDREGNYIPTRDVIEWYAGNSRIPEIVRTKPFVEDGALLAVDDSGFSQGYEAVLIANDILYNHADPAVYAPRTPRHGQLLVNRQRAAALGIDTAVVPNTVIRVDTVYRTSESDHEME